MATLDGDLAGGGFALWSRHDHKIPTPEWVKPGSRYQTPLARIVVSTQWFNPARQIEGLQASAARPWAIALVENHQKGEVLNNIGRFITVDLLTQELKGLNPHAAAGIDRVTLKDLRLLSQAEIPVLVKQLRNRTYRCKPNRRVIIRKSDGSPRYLGIPCMRDKLVGTGIKAILEPACEEMFSPHSYAYRPGRGCHHALADLESRIAAMQGGFLLDLDVEKFFDRVSHIHLMDFIRQMVSDPIILHAIHETLVAGTLIRDENRGGMHLERTGQGTPQGGVISPLLANIYLHHVFDSYIADVLSPTIPGGVSYVRYADDIVCLVKDAESAIRVRESLDKRFGDYGIPLHPLKSKTLDFRRPDLAVGDTGFERSGFDYLGFRVEWKLTPNGIWKLSKEVASGRPERGIEKTRVIWTRSNRLGMTNSELSASLNSRVIGFGKYYCFDECRDGVETYGYGLAKLLESLRLKDDSDQFDEDPHSSKYLPLSSWADAGARHA